MNPTTVTIRVVRHLDIQVPADLPKETQWAKAFDVAREIIPFSPSPRPSVSYGYNYSTVYPSSMLEFNPDITFVSTSEEQIAEHVAYLQAQSDPFERLFDTLKCKAYWERPRPSEETYAERLLKAARPIIDAQIDAGEGYLV